MKHVLVGRIAQVSAALLATGAFLFGIRSPLRDDPMPFLIALVNVMAITLPIRVFPKVFKVAQQRRMGWMLLPVFITWMVAGLLSTALTSGLAAIVCLYLSGWWLVTAVLLSDWHPAHRRRLGPLEPTAEMMSAASAARAAFLREVDVNDQPGALYEAVKAALAVSPSGGRAQ